MASLFSAAEEYYQTGRDPHGGGKENGHDDARSAKIVLSIHAAGVTVGIGAADQAFCAYSCWTGCWEAAARPAGVDAGGNDGAGCYGLHRRGVAV